MRCHLFRIDRYETKDTRASTCLWRRQGVGPRAPAAGETSRAGLRRI